MHHAKFRVGLIQMACAKDPNENLAKAEWRIREAAGKGAQVLFYPTAIGWHPSEKAQYGVAQPQAVERGNHTIDYSRGTFPMTQANGFPLVFGGLEPHLSSFEKSQVLIWPVPFEKTVSYGRGTAEGPAAILDASRYMELYDEEIGGESAAVGIHTLPAIDADRPAEEMIPILQREARELLKTNKFLCMLGGEHSISAPVVRAFREKFPGLSVLQIDAHADLRDSYEGTPLSHASTMRRILEVCPAVQVGIRSLSAEEARAIPHLPTRIFYAKDISGRTGWVDDAVEALTDDVYLTIDIDGLDPSLVPSTGTPEPGGLMWNEVLTLIRTLAGRRNVVGMDLVELCRSSTTSAPSFLAAKLIYKTLGYIFRKQIPQLDLDC